MIADLPTYVSSLYQQYTALIWVLLILVALATGVVLSNFLYVRQVAENGKVTITPKFKFPLLFQRSANSRRTEPPKPYTGKQRRLLARFFSVQTTLFGLSVFMLGQVLLGSVLMNIITKNDQPLFTSLTIAYLLAGAICTPLGILLIYQRDKNNPFK